MKRVLSLFSGCGGMDLGFHGGFIANKKSIINDSWIESRVEENVKLKRTDFDIVFANDIKQQAKTVWMNYFRRYGVNDDIYNVSSIVDLVKTHKLTKNEFPDNIDLITGGFPCQDFSIAGRRLAFNSNRSHEGKPLGIYESPRVENRGELYIWMKEVIRMVKPKMFIAENVKGMTSIPNIVNTIKRDFETIPEVKYIVLDPQILHAANFGVPQSRERIFFIGLNVDFINKNIYKHFKDKSIPEELSPYPQITHYLPNQNNTIFDSKGISKFVSTLEALKDLPEPWQSKDLTHRSRSKANFIGSHHRGQEEIDLDSISPAIRAEHHGNIQFRRLNKKNGGKNIEKGLWQRRLSIRECARLQTFPDDYNFILNGIANPVTMTQGYKLVGDAVPPVLAFNIAFRIQEIWNNLF